jgi:hypothetical protein
MTPFAKSVSTILSNTSPCTTYTPSSSAGPTSRFSVMEDGMSVRQASSTALTISSPAEKNNLLTAVAQKKQQDANGYRAEVLMGLSKVDSMQRASREFNMPENLITQGVEFYQTLLLKLGLDVVGDASIGSKSTQTIAAEGRAQAAGMQSGNTSSSMQSGNTSSSTQNGNTSSS